MTRRLCAGTVLVLSGWLPGVASAEETFEQRMQQLFKLTGRWVIEEAYTSPEGVTGTGSARFDQSLEDTHVLLEYKSKTKEWKLEGHAVFTYDQPSGKFRYWWFANLGQARVFTGDFSSQSQKLTFVEDSNGFPVQRHTFRFVTEDHVEFKMESSDDGRRCDLDLTTTYTRKGSKRDGDKDTTKKKRPAVRG